MKNILIVILFSFALQVIQAQDISGEWIGILTQKAGGYSQSYAFSMNLIQTNDSVEGYSYISLWDKPQIYGKIKLKGIFSNQIFSFQESDVLSENRGNLNFVWCIKEGSLKYFTKGDSSILEGEWFSSKTPRCAPGAIRLAKYYTPPQQVTEQTDTNVENNVTYDEIDTTRQLKTGHNVTVPNNKVKIFVSDASLVDDDTISLIFNGKIILEKYALTKTPYQLTIRCNPNEENKVVMYAHNMGEVPPNTAKIQIISGRYKKTIRMDSNTDESDVIYINVKK